MAVTSPPSLALVLKDWAEASPSLPSLLEDASFLSRHATISRDTFKAASVDACAPPPLSDLSPFVAEVATRAPALGAAPPPPSFAPPSARARPIKTASNLQVPPLAFAH